MAKRMTIALPDKPSALLEVALADLRACEIDKKYYHVDMGFWHQPEPDDDGVVDTRCFVCFAGAVMAQTGGASILMDLTPDDYDEVTGNKLIALDKFRDGAVSSALMVLGYDVDNPEICPPGEEWAGMACYKEDRRQFRNDMKALIKTLKRRGL